LRGNLVEAGAKQGLRIVGFMGKKVEGGHRGGDQKSKNELERAILKETHRFERDDHLSRGATAEPSKNHTGLGGIGVKTSWTRKNPVSELTSQEIFWRGSRICGPKKQLGVRAGKNLRIKR